MFSIKTINPVTLTISLFIMYYLYNKIEENNLYISDLEDQIETKKERIIRLNKKITLTIKLLKIAKKNELYYKHGIFNNDTSIKILPRNETKNKGICMCVLGKLSNIYIKEFISFYKKMGVDKIFLYDNNWRPHEKFESVLKSEVESGFVNITDIRGYYGIQDFVNNECYQRNRYNYSWIIFFDLDEFIYFKDNKTTLKDFLYHPKFNNCDVIKLNWRFYTDNDYLRYKNESVIKRFSTPSKYQRRDIKSIIRGGLGDFIMEVHSPIFLNNTCDVNGNFINLTKNYLMDLKYDYAYLKHYYTKTVEEFCKKIRGGSANAFNLVYPVRMEGFFHINSITDEKILFLEKCLNVTGLKEEYYTK